MPEDFVDRLVGVVALFVIVLVCSGLVALIKYTWSFIP